MATATQPTYAQLQSQIAKGVDKLAPLYILHGEEGYYIDRLVEAFEGLVPETDRDFDLQVLYGSQVEPVNIIQATRCFPMMQPRLVVIVKEMQSVIATDIDKLIEIAESPSPQCVVVFAFRGAKAKGASFMAAAKKNGAVVFEGKPLKENQVGSVISGIVHDKGLNIEPKGLSMLTDFVGTDLSRLYNEVSKLTVALPKGAMITPEVIERNIGISKEYNNFELIEALTTRNAQKAYKIVDRFAENPKGNPWAMTMGLLYNFFSDLIIYQFSKDKSPQAVAAALGAKSTWVVGRYEKAARYYNGFQTLEIMSALRRTDAQMKGNGSSRDPYILLKELMINIITAQGILPVKQNPVTL